ncbi:phage late control D family protein [Roseospira goensis]|uniref:Phage tail protein n=1 Tax=Roseospira goensis TaxID=391922 RepID=A0A7W6WMD7_9PROT|nr:contractile injection system protein, VgrG/Pvc8 family [Roseospira goensis]MBB4287834.1 hypothetical protein [Roseospira goensis]
MKTPFIRIWHGDVDLAERWGPLLTALTVTDERGLEADTVAVTLDDRDGRIVYPRTHETIRIEGGYLEIGAVVQGDYIIDQVDLTGWPQTIVLHGASVDALSAAKERRTEAHQPPAVPTLGALADLIAARNGWIARVAPALAAVPVEYEAQTAESDPSFLGRVAARHGGLVAIKQGHLVVAPQSAGVSVSGRTLDPLVIRTGVNLLDYRVSWKDREKHGTIQARTYDRGRVEAVEVEAGDGSTGVAYRFREPFPSAAEAQAAVNAKAAALKRAEGSATFTLEGDPAMAAERPVEVIDVRAGVDGRWTPMRVEHRWSADGYTTVVECETPGSGDTRGTGS